MRVGDITDRLNLTIDDQDWLSLRPSDNRYFIDDYFGDFDEYNKLNGRGIKIDSFDGSITIAFWKHCNFLAPGNYLAIWSSGDVSVGEYYMKDGMMLDRGTLYRTDGTTKKLGF